MQRGKSRFAVRLEVRIHLDQYLHDLRVLLRSGPHQRGLILSWLFGVHIGAMNEQHANRVGAAGPGARHQWRLARSDRRVWAGTRFQKQINELSASVRARLRERRHPKIVRRIGIGAGPDQQLRRSEIIPMRDPQERRRAVFGSNIHVWMPVQQSTHLLQVLIFRRVDEPEILVCGGSADNHEQRQ